MTFIIYFNILLLNQFLKKRARHIWINNTKIFKEIVKEYGTFSNYLKIFSNGKIYYEIDKTSSWLSDDISCNLKRRGMKFVGTTIIYSFLQAIGIIYSHDKDCFLYRGK